VSEAYPFVLPSAISLIRFFCPITDELSTVRSSIRLLGLNGIAATPSGVLIVCCGDTHSVYAIDPSTGYCEWIAGMGCAAGEMKAGPALAAVFNEPMGVAVVDSECGAYVSEGRSHSIRRLSLPPNFFLSRECTLSCLQCSSRVLIKCFGYFCCSAEQLFSQYLKVSGLLGCEWLLLPLWQMVARYVIASVFGTFASIC
jgi:hypothetical protein